MPFSSVTLTDKEFPHTLEQLNKRYEKAHPEKDIAPSFRRFVAAIILKACVKGVDDET